ncbi:LysR family transcriptional regulator [Actinomadura napierensis]|uniref:LysR family transcriptional regulator n=1 Tax=Actinomadura napierensis TaxID=267854 RepID=UPI0031DD5235
MDLDLAQVRAFVATAEHLHFGRAAGELFLTQQALSKRIARLEDVLGLRLFDRTGHSVALTAAGERFLEPARRALAAADDAIVAARRDDRPLRLDVWGHLFDPMRTIGQVVARRPDLPIEPNLKRGLPEVVTALGRGDGDAGFGRVHALDEPLPGGLAHRLVRLAPMAAVMSEDHPLADAATLRPADLRGTTVWFPAEIGKLDFLDRFLADFGLSGEFGGVNLGLDFFLGHLRAETGHASLLPADVPVPDGVRSVPLTGPVPLYSWSLIWRAREQHPVLRSLLAEFAAAAREHGWLDYDPAVHWLPPTELDTRPVTVPSEGRPPARRPASGLG